MNEKRDADRPRGDEPASSNGGAAREHAALTTHELVPLAGSVALVTGGASDIGMAVAGELVQRDVTVVLADIDAERIEAGARHLEGRGGRVVPIGVDLSDGASCQKLVEDARDQVGPIRTLVNAAATTFRARVHEMPDDVWDRLVAVNLSSVYWTCRAAIRQMIGDGGGVIVNMGSIAGVRGLPGSPIYAATKGGVVALSRALALDHVGDGIRVHVLTPPAVDTRSLWNGLFANTPDPGAAKEAYERSQPAGRMLTTAEIANVVVFLAEGVGPVFSPEPIYF